MPAGRPVPLRKRIFVAAEGDGERALAGWLQSICDEQGLRVHLDVVVAGGGDTRSVVEFALDRRQRRIDSKGQDKGALDFLYADRRLRERADPATVKGRDRLHLVYLTPILEGFFVRLHGGCETQFASADDATKRLLRLWPKYRKPMPVRALRKRFKLASLRRAVQHDSQLRKALIRLGLP